MVHPALLRSSSLMAFVGHNTLAKPQGPKALERAKHLLQHLSRSVSPGYRPERHYMRGGRTAGAKSLAAD